VVPTAPQRPLAAKLAKSPEYTAQQIRACEGSVWAGRGATQATARRTTTQAAHCTALHGVGMVARPEGAAAGSGVGPTYQNVAVHWPALRVRVSAWCSARMASAIHRIPAHESSQPWRVLSEGVCSGT
jgi:hypothetical protein